MAASRWLAAASSAGVAAPTASSGTELSNPSERPTPVRGLEGVRVIALSAGEHHTCALLGDGTVSCWGRWGEMQRDRQVRRLAVPEDHGLVKRSRVLTRSIARP